MYQIDNSTAAQAIPASTAAGSKGYFTDGNPATGTPATILPAEFMNMLMMENINVLAAAGIQPDKSKFNQLALAISTITGANLTWANIQGKPTTLSGYGITNAYTVGQIDGFFAVRDTSFNGLSAEVGRRVIMGGGVGQSNNTINIGWSNSGLKLSVDGVDQGVFWLSTSFNPATKADKAITLGGYGITDGATKTELNNQLSSKADKATTLSGYGITNAYTVGQIDGFFAVRDKSFYTIDQVNGFFAVRDTSFNALSAEVYAANPVGAIVHFAQSAAPSGFLKANGAWVSRTAYARLFAAIGTFYGPGDGVNSFTLPDLRGEFVRSWDDARGVDFNRPFGSVQLGAIEAHSHAMAAQTDWTYNPVSTTNFKPFKDATGSYQTGVTGGSETRPRNVALLACIKY